MIGRNGRNGAHAPTGVRILRLAGEFDYHDVPAIRAWLDAALAEGALRLVVDMKGVRFASAAVLGCLLRGRLDARRRRGDLVLSAPSAFLRTLLRVLRADRMIGVFADDAAALRHYRAEAPRRPPVRLELLRGGAGARPRLDEPRPDRPLAV